MAIPIKRYIDVNSTVIRGSTSSIDLSALIFVSTAMQGTGSKKTAYDKGEAVGLSSDEVATYFAQNSDVMKFATSYFGYVNANGRSPSLLYVAKTGLKTGGDSSTTETALETFRRVTTETSNFGSFAFLDSTIALGTSGSGVLLDIAMTNASFGRKYLCVIPVTTANYTTISDALKGTLGTHLVLGSDSYAAYMPMAWAATLNYDSMDGSASALMYRPFPSSMSLVDNEADANKYDSAFVNYVGTVQTRAVNRSFYQRGINADSEDTGVYMDSVWLTSAIEDGWINLATTDSKITANSAGLAKIYAMINTVITQALNNRVILKDKPLSANAITEIIELTGDNSVINDIETNGYYLFAYLDRQMINGIENDICNYILIYAKGDQIKKINGTHILA